MNGDTNEPVPPASKAPASFRDYLAKAAMMLGAVLLLAACAVGLYRFSSYAEGKGDAVALSLVVLVGLALVVALVAGLTIVYSFLGVENKSQPLALPEGSVRALLAFSLLLTFVCLATFVYQGAKGTELVAEGKLLKVTAAQVAELRREFVVVDEPARRPDGSLDQDVVGTVATPLFNVSYYRRQPRKDADDLGKQIFTTLATVFVSVVSFYFGSSSTASGIGIGIGAGPGGGTPPRKDTPAG